MQIGPGTFISKHTKIIRLYSRVSCIFTEQLSDWLFGIFPYYVQKRVYNREDFIFNDFKGIQTIIYNIKPLNKKRMTDGFTGEGCDWPQT